MSFEEELIFKDQNWYPDVFEPSRERIFGSKNWIARENRVRLKRGKRLLVRVNGSFQNMRVQEIAILVNIFEAGETNNTLCYTPQLKYVS